MSIRPLSHAELQALLAHLDHHDRNERLLTGPGGRWPAAGEPVVAVRVRASVGRPGASAQAEYRRRRASERAAWTRGLLWRATAVLAAGAAAGLLAIQLAPHLTPLAVVLAVVGLGWQLRFRPSGLSLVTCGIWGSASCSCGSGIPPPQEAEVRKRHIVVLSEEERARLHTMIGRGVAPASALTHARILLKANQGEGGPSWTDAAIGAALEVNPATVARVRARYVAAGLEAAVYRKPPARQYRRRLDGEQEARLVALTCSAPPEGHKRWTLRLLADRLVELQVVESVSYETVRQALKQTSSSRG